MCMLDVLTVQSLSGMAYRGTLARMRMACAGGKILSYDFFFMGSLSSLDRTPRRVLYLAWIGTGSQKRRENLRDSP